MSAAPPLPELRRTAVVDFLFLDLSRCERCQSSGANIDKGHAPSNLRRVFAAKEAGASEGGCCG